MNHIVKCTALLVIAGTFTITACSDSNTSEPEDLETEAPMPPIEKPVTITSKIDLLKSHHSDYSYFLVDIHHHTEIHVSLSSDEAELLNSLDPDQEYVISLWFSAIKYEYEDHHHPEAELQSISIDNQTLTDRSICPLHDIPMNRGSIFIRFGFPNQELLDAFDSFHGGPGFVLGGCAVSNNQQYFNGYSCPICVDTYKSWAVEHEQEH